MSPPCLSRRPSIHTMTLATVTAGLLSACSGGGGGPSGGISLRFTPGTLSAEQFQGESKQVTITADATVTGSITGTIYATIHAPGSIFAGDPQIEANGNNPYEFFVIFTVNPQAPLGNNSGAIKIDLCGDPNCGTAYGHASLPYNIQIDSSSNLTPLSNLPGAYDYTALGGSPNHSSYVPVTLDPTRFSVRWQYAIPNFMGDSPASAAPAVVSNGVVYFPVNVSANYGNGTQGIYALRESDGSLLWTYTGSVDTGVACGMSAIGISGTQLAVVVGNNLAKSSLQVLDASTGAVTWSTPFTNGSTQPVPVIANGAVFTPWGAYNAMTGVADWLSTSYAFEDTAVQDGVGYTIADNGFGQRNFAAFDPTNGALLFSVINTSFSASDTAPTVDPSGTDAVLQSSGEVSDIDLANHVVRWFNDSSTFFGSAAIRNGEVYLQTHDIGPISPTSGLDLEVHRESDGHLLWHWTAPVANESLFLGAPIVTDNLVFVSTDQNVYAIDLQTHKTVWTYPRAGMLSMSSNGILYIARANNNDQLVDFPNDGYLVAINLH